MKHQQDLVLNQSNDLQSDFCGFKLSISPRKVTGFLLIVVGVLVILSLISQLAVNLLPSFPLGGLRAFIASKLSVDQEQSFPALYSSISLFFCSILFLIIAQNKSKTKDKYTVFWKNLFVIFTLLALDELLSFHEYLSNPLRKLGFDGIFHYAWVIPGFLIVGIFCIVFYRFFQHLPRYMKRYTLWAMLTFIGGAIFVETVGGYYQYLHGKNSIGYLLIATTEEVMEMIGVIILIHGLLTYIEKTGINKINFQLNVSQSHSGNSQQK
ncbi:MAG: hypothetical protein WBA13_03700 [Microcoleaceae cyanobacterium]